MNWGGFGNYGSSASAYANRGSAFGSTYARGGYRGGAGFGGGGFGSHYSYGGAGAGGGGLNSSATSAYRTNTNTNSPSSSASSLGTGTARVAVLGIAPSVFSNWWALHAAGFQVSVVVGVADAQSKESTKTAGNTAAAAASPERTPVAASAEEQKESAETARDFALRCTQFYRLPKKTTATAGTSTATTSFAVKSATSPSLASATMDSAADAAKKKADDEKAAEKAAVVDVVVRISDDLPKEDSDKAANLAASSSSAAGASGGSSSFLPAVKVTTTTSATTAAGKETRSEHSITATSWGYFLKPYFDAQSGKSTSDKSNAAAISAFGGGGGSSSYWSNRGGAAGASTAATNAAAAETTPLIDDVEIVYLASYTAPAGSSNPHPPLDDASLRAVLIWLIGKGKHLVVDCVLSSETVAACAAAAATMTRGKAEMHRLFLYRGGGLRRGWSTAAMTHLRTALAVKRGTGQATKAVKEGADNTNTSVSEASKTAANTTTTTTATSTAKPAAKATTPEADDAFSVFDFMGGDGSPFGGALKDAESSATPINAALNTKKDEKEEMKEKKTEEEQEKEKEKQTATPPIVTSLAVNAEDGVAGALRQLRFTVRGSGLGGGASDADAVPWSSSLGVMDTLGWDAVAWVLHLLDWTCPDMVQGRVVRRSTTTGAPVCVEAELYYGIDGSVKDEEGAATVVAQEDKQPLPAGGLSDVAAACPPPLPSTSAAAGEVKATQRKVPARPDYVRVLLHISATGVNLETGVAASDSDDGSARVFQQSVRAVGSKAVVSVLHPLLPRPSTTAVSAAATSSSTPPPPAASATSPFKVTSTRTMTGAGMGGTGTTATTAATSTTAVDSALPATPAVSYTYVVATQDAPPGSSGRLRKEDKVTVPAAEGGEPCAEARLWQHVRSQLNVTATTSASGAAGMGGGGYQPYGSRYATRGRYGASVGLGGGGGGVGGGLYGRGRGAGGGYGTATAAPTTQTVVKAELNAAEAAALDVQRAWLVQMVVEHILVSAALT